MSFTRLQKVALNQAGDISESLEDRMHALARHHKFGDQLCTLKTPENEMIKEIRKLTEIIDALRAEKQ